jgi:pyrroline-5-carboxylate reductase
LLISIAAGKTTEFIRKSLTHDNRIIRVMPNINAKVGEAMSAYTANEQATVDDKLLCEKIFGGVGQVINLEETYFPLFGVIAGCAPAFGYMFIDALARAGVKNGMKKDTALMIAAQTILGSAKMILESNEHPWELIDQVCSPGGTTIEAVTSLQSDGFESAVHNAVDKAIQKDSKL